MALNEQHVTICFDQLMSAISRVDFQSHRDRRRFIRSAAHNIANSPDVASELIARANSTLRSAYAN